MFRTAKASDRWSAKLVHGMFLIILPLGSMAIPGLVRGHRTLSCYPGLAPGLAGMASSKGMFAMDSD